MKKNQILLFLYLALMSNSCFSQQHENYTLQEAEYDQLFTEFKQYLANSVTNKLNEFDSAALKKLSLKYMFVNGVLDSSNSTSFNDAELTSRQYQNLAEQTRRLYQYFVEHQKTQLATHLAALPIRFATDKYIAGKLSPYQRANTFIYFDERKPEQVLGYMLFIPKIPGKLSHSRIMSTTLLFESGMWVFRSFTGDIGLEYFLSEGIRPPSQEKIIH